MEYDEGQQQNQVDQDETSGSGPNQGIGNRERDRDRRGRGERGTRFSDADPSNGGRDRSRERRNCRIYVSNIPYDYRWQDLKDLFRRVVGSVEYVELFSDETGKARGCGIVEFKDPDNVEKALETMNRYEINGREIVVKEDHGENRDQYGRIVRDGMGGGGGGGGGGGIGGGNRDRGDRGFSRRDRDDDRISGRHMGMGGSGGGGMITSNDYDMPYNTYGLSTSFLESLGINGPLHTKVFVANLDYKVDTKKLKQVFKLAGKVQSVDLSLDKEGNSRGFAVIEYDHPVEAVQAISMFDRQMLYDRRMTVRLDRIPDKGESIKLPEGLGGIGIGLGPNGEPLRDVARNLPNMGQNQSSLGGGGGGGNGSVGGMGSLNQNSVPVPVAPPLNGPSGNLLGTVGNTPVLSNTNLAALSSVVGGLKNLAGVGAALSNPLLSNSLSNLGLNLGGGSAGGSTAGGVGDDSGQSTQNPNSYNSGGNYNTGYSSSTFNSGGRSDFDPNVRSYNTQPQDSGDYGSTGGNMYGSQMGAARKSDTIVIKNIPLSCTWQTLRDKFRDIGEVKFAEIRGNDVGVVRFFKDKDAELAIKLMDGSRMEGRTVSVNFF